MNAKEAVRKVFHNQNVTQGEARKIIQQAISEAVAAEQKMVQELFGMTYKLMRALAIRCLKDSNDSRENEGDWPSGQEWGDLVGTSHSIFKYQAREEAGINSKKFLGILRDREGMLEIAEEIESQKGGK